MTHVGVIFHWGLYSVPAFHKQSRPCPGNGSEWYLKRLMTKEDAYRPIAGHTYTKEYHADKYGDMDYFEFANMFEAERYDPDSWMKLCKSIGASYVILTAKHHDGFCLWNTSTTSYNSVEKGPHRDLLANFFAAASRYGLAAGVYYSWMEFGKSCTKQFMSTIVIPQVEELISYQPKIFWFDGGWVCKTQVSCDIISSLCHKIRESIRGVHINDRLGSCPVTKKRQEDPAYLGDATFRNYADRALPRSPPGVPWESVVTIGHSWGYNAAQPDSAFKTGEELFDLHGKVRRLRGRLLINLGPKADGTLDQREVDSLVRFGVLTNHARH